jgi:hypothetical protein
MGAAGSVTVLEFIREMLALSQLPYSVDQVLEQTATTAIEMIDTNDNPFDDKYADSLRYTKTVQEAIDLITQNAEYYVVFMSALLVYFDREFARLESAGKLNLNAIAKQRILELLDLIKIF